MNIPPTDGIRVDAESLCSLVRSIFENIPIPADHARLIADLLVDTELRGVISHGVGQVERYVRDFQNGTINPAPAPRLLKEGPVTATFSGDGGLGMIVATKAISLAIPKARDQGVAIATTTYHGHVGSVGKYVRMALREDLIGIGFSGRCASPQYDYEAIVQASIQGSPPLAFGFPAGPDHPAFLLDMASHVPWDEACFKKMPQVFYKAMGLSHVANILSGTLGGQMLPEFDRRTIQHERADQSGFFMAIDIERFVPPEAFKNDIDHLMDEVRKMQPYPGYTEALLPGVLEWQKERAYPQEGIPITADAKTALEQLADELGCSVPWS